MNDLLDEGYTEESFRAGHNSELDISEEHGIAHLERVALFRVQNLWRAGKRTVFSHELTRQASVGY